MKRSPNQAMQRTALTKSARVKIIATLIGFPMRRAFHRRVRDTQGFKSNSLSFFAAVPNWPRW